MSYPLPVFHFKVQWGQTEIAFSEVTGLNVEVQPIEYRSGESPEYSMQKMPGLRKYGNITMKRGVFASDNKYWEWLNTIKLNSPDRRSITVSLLNEDHHPVMTWSIINAWPTKLTSPDLKAGGNETAIESIEIAHEGVSIDNP